MCKKRKPIPGGRNPGRDPVEKPCTIAGCEKLIYASELCQMHYFRKYRTGTTAEPPKKQRTICSVEDCSTFVNSFGLCLIHVMQSRRENGYCYKCGYVRGETLLCDPCRDRMNEQRRMNRAFSKLRKAK